MKRFALALSGIMAWGMLPGQELLQNGGFELPVAVYDTTSQGDDGEWVRKWEAVGVDSSHVYAGRRSLRISAELPTGNGYVFCRVKKNLGNFEASFMVYPASSTFENVFALGANWRDGAFDPLFRMKFSHEQLTVQNGGEEIYIPYRLTTGSWHRVQVISDRDGYRQTIFIDNGPVATVEAVNRVLVEHVFLGDYTRRALFGTLYYDEVSVTNRRGSSFYAHNDFPAAKTATGGPESGEAETPAMADGQADGVFFNIRGSRTAVARKPGIYIECTEGRFIKKLR